MAQAQALDRFLLTQRADLGDGLALAAVVATQLAFAFVPGQRHRAVRTLHPVAAALAQKERRVATAVQKQDRLLAGVEGFL